MTQNTWYKNPVIPSKNSFTEMRFIFCSIIALEHCLGYLELWRLELRHYGVFFFFVLSGFWVYQSACSSSSILSYFKKRIRKILPLYYFVLLATLLGFSFLSNLGVGAFWKSKSTIRYAIANSVFLGFLQESLPGIADGFPVNGSLWTLKIEIGYYLLLPAIILYITRHLNLRNIRKTGLSKTVNIILFSLCAVDVIMIFSVILFQKLLNLPESFNHQLQWYLPLFIGGMLCVNNFELLLKARTNHVLWGGTNSLHYVLFFE